MVVTTPPLTSASRPLETSAAFFRTGTFGPKRPLTKIQPPWPPGPHGVLSHSNPLASVAEVKEGTWNLRGSKQVYELIKPS